MLVSSDGSELLHDRGRVNYVHSKMGSALHYMKSMSALEVGLWKVQRRSQNGYVSEVDWMWFLQHFPISIALNHHRSPLSKLSAQRP